MPTYKFPTYDVTDQGNMPGDGALRVGGQTIPGMPSADVDRPDKLSKAAERQRPALKLVRDCWPGTERLREETTEYLPKAPGEDQANYKIRLERSVFFNVFARTIDGLVGQVFKKDPKLGDDVPPLIVEQWENLDNAGTHGDVFLRDLLQDALTTGHAAILVDFPNLGLVVHRGQEKGARPYWVAIKKENILSWRTTVVDGKTILAQVVLLECTMVPDGMFGEKEQKLYRVLYRNDDGVVGFSLLRITEDKRVIEEDFGIYGNQDEIPLAEIKTSGTTSIFESAPPLLDLAYLNIAHYQQWSDQATSLHMTCVPLLTRIGFDSYDDKGKGVIVGASSVLDLPMGADAKYVSHDGAAAGSCQAALDDLISNMGTLGIGMLAPQKRTAETATAKRMDKSTEESSLAVTARGLEDGAERALGFHAKYLKVSTGGGSIDINREFEDQTMQADILSAWTQAVTAGVPARLMIEAMQTGGLISPEEDVDDIALEMEAAAQAKADAEAQALQDRASMAQSAKPKQAAA